ncbi:hypothetical protein [Rhodoferax antarcticus]|uniref:Uncharacterized protein n=1 Tax=Rhodoferax antarcticus ANT.BR TaxID=1111071 RepID=A0A1Q8YDZ3_9BURK|nr:hypothetical protein [Rhodoferax antarcticus]MCW2310318.1 hypothetical protein [Rhodoferax antarcticus]OLP06281.1 hypothetical protein BLL52_2512 [Rhodoferax antarcticus ANT.BR]
MRLKFKKQAYQAVDAVTACFVGRPKRKLDASSDVADGYAKLMALMQ